MLLHLTDQTDESLQKQISRQIRAKILAEELTADTSLPSIRAMAKEQHVSVITVQRAYETLLHEELIHSRRGKGFFVSNVSKQNKKEISKKRLMENLERPLFAAIEEGLPPPEIFKIVEKSIKKINSKNKFKELLND